MFALPVRQIVSVNRRVVNLIRYAHSTNHNHQEHHVEEKFGGVERPYFIHLIEKTAPFITNLFSPQVQKLSKNELHIRLPANKELIGNPILNCYHGGVTATMLDHCGGFCAWASLDDPFLRVNTADLRVDYFLPALCEDLFFDAVILHKSNKLIRTDIYCRDSNGRLVASGRAAFNVYKAEHDLGVLIKKAAKASTLPNKVIDVEAKK